MSDETAEAVRLWRAKAQNDWTTVEILLTSDRCPADTVCFDCQQFVEKLLMGLLARYGIETPRTHDLRRLIQLAEPFAPELSPLSDESDTLTVYGVESRCPDAWRKIESPEMNDVVDLTKELGNILLSKIQG